MPKSDLTYRTNTDEADTKTNDTSFANLRGGEL